MSGGSGAFEAGNLASWIGGNPAPVNGTSAPTAQQGTTPAWQTAAQPQVMQPNPNPYAPPTPANMPPPVTDMAGPGVNAAYNWSPQQQQPAPQAPQGGIGGLAQQPSYDVVQPYQQPQPEAPAFGGAYTQKYYNRS